MTRPDNWFTRYLSLAGANFLSAAFGLLVAALLARYFGPAGFGEISLATTLISYAIVISSCGTGLYAVRTVAMGQNNLQSMIPAVITIRLLLSIVVFIGLAMCAYTIPMLYESRFLILLFGVTLFSNSVLLLWVPQSVHRTHAVAFGKGLLQFLNLCFLYLFLMFNSSLYMAPIALILAESLVAIGLMLSIRRYVTGVEPIPGLAAMRALLRESAPIGLTQFIRTFALASDLIILAFITAYSEVGIYAAAYKIFLFMLSLGSAYFIILLPRIAELSGSVKLIQEELKKSFLRVMPIVANMVIVVWVIADFLISLLFGVDYAGAGDVLRVLSLAMVANLVARHYRQVLLVRKMQNTDLKISTYSGVVHLLAKLLLIPLFGIIGCALGTLIGEVFLMLGQRTAAKRELSSNAVAQNPTGNAG